MSHLTIVRHGQASFFADDYDQLSDLGAQQAWLLGDYWGSLRLVIDEVYSGPRLRQQKSAEYAGQSYQKSGLSWPDPQMLNDLDEYDLDGLSNRFAARLALRDEKFAELALKHRQSEGEHERLRNFQRMFETLLRHWQAHEGADEDVESWPAFRERVRRAIRIIQDQSGRGRRVVLFTSGGFIGAAVQHALGVSDAMALELNWRIRNCSLTEFVFTQDRFTLDNFNMTPHLSDPAFWTYR